MLFMKNAENVVSNTPFFYKHPVNLTQPQLCLNILRIEPYSMLTIYDKDN